MALTLTKRENEAGRKELHTDLPTDLWQLVCEFACGDKTSKKLFYPDWDRVRTKVVFNDLSLLAQRFELYKITEVADEWVFGTRSFVPVSVKRCIQVDKDSVRMAHCFQYAWKQYNSHCSTYMAIYTEYVTLEDAGVKNLIVDAMTIRNVSMSCCNQKFVPLEVPASPLSVVYDAVKSSEPQVSGVAWKRMRRAREIRVRNHLRLQAALFALMLARAGVVAEEVTLRSCNGSHQKIQWLTKPLMKLEAWHLGFDDVAHVDSLGKFCDPRLNNPLWGLKDLYYSEWTVQSFKEDLQRAVSAFVARATPYQQITYDVIDDGLDLASTSKERVLDVADHMWSSWCKDLCCYAMIVSLMCCAPFQALAKVSANIIAWVWPYVKARVTWPMVVGVWTGISFVLAVVYVLLRCICRPLLRLLAETWNSMLSGCLHAIRPLEIKEDKQVSKDEKFVLAESKDGHVVFRLSNEGMEDRSPERVAEMAIPGSLLSVSKPRNVGAIMVAENSELSLLGCFWRYEDMLITADHVANKIRSIAAEIYLVGYDTRRGAARLNTRNLLNIAHEKFDVEKNIFQCETLDVFVMKLQTEEWAKLGISKSSVKRGSLYNMNVSAHGWQNTVLMTSGGVLLRHELSDSELAHTCSTNKGFSGSPILCGNSVVAMHIAAHDKVNICVRIEAILCRLPVQEAAEYYPGSYEKEFKRDGHYKVDGRDWAVREEHGQHYLLAANGRMIPMDEYEVQEWQNQRRSNECADIDNFEVVTYQKPSEQEFRDTQNCDLKESSKKRGLLEVKEENEDFIEYFPVNPVHISKVPAENAEIAAYFEGKLETIEKLGYVRGEQAWVDNTAAREVKSLKNHLKLYANRVRGIKRPPTQKEIDRCVQIVASMVEQNAFLAPIGYKTKDHINYVINSNLIDPKKSAGMPYQREGTPTNADVLRKYDNFHEIVLREWDSDYEVKWFGKAEPNKQKKILLEMTRGVTGLPLHKLVKHQAIYRNMLERAVEMSNESPIAYAFSPQKAGHCEKMARRFRGKKVGECDKSNWDFHMFVYIFIIVREVIKLLARKPVGMSDEEFAQYVQDLGDGVDEVCNKGIYTCTDGSQFKSVFLGIMFSGYLLTIFANSLGQIVVHVLICMRMGKSDEYIMGLKFVAGGDDTLQEIPDDFDVEEYKLQAADLGFTLEFKVNTEFSGSEFFSNKFKVRKDGIVTYEPVRWTKHVEKMKRVKIEDLASALGSAMINYCWVNDKYKFFEDMYAHFQKIYGPELFPMTFWKTKQQLQHKTKGFESYDEIELSDEQLNFDGLLDKLVLKASA